MKQEKGLGLQSQCPFSKDAWDCSPRPFLGHFHQKRTKRDGPNLQHLYLAIFTINWGKVPKLAKFAAATEPTTIYICIYIYTYVATYIYIYRYIWLRVSPLSTYGLAHYPRCVQHNKGTTNIGVSLMSSHTVLHQSKICASKNATSQTIFGSWATRWIVG